MVSLFCEGNLDAITLRRIIASKTQLSVGVVVSGKGKPYLRSKAQNLNLSARGHPIIVLADQDNSLQCAPQQITDWLGGQQQSNNFLLRFAKLTIEAWFLADKDNLSAFLSVSTALIPNAVETLENPKTALVNLARRSSSRAIRDALVPNARSGATVGPNYSAELSRFVTDGWDIDAATNGCDSLRRTVLRIVELDARVAAAS